jgi:membrane peptidoglycan carboxypeptidase
MPTKRLKYYKCLLALLAVALLFAIVHMITSNAVRPYMGTGVPLGYSQYVRLDQVSQPMQDAIVAMEDGNFYTLGLAAIYQAFTVDIQPHRVLERRITIAQQLAKNF